MSVEIKTFFQNKDQHVWIFTTLEVWLRPWISTAVGRRSYHNVKQVNGQAIRRGRFNKPILFTTDGHKPYLWAAKRLLGIACVFAQVIKTRRNNRVICVERNLAIGTKAQLVEALLESDDSSTVNTSFIERHNLTVRQGSSYLRRRTPGHARYQEYLEGNLALQQLHYNFVRPHSALRFGNEVRTPAWQAGLVERQLSFRDVFMSREELFYFVVVLVNVQRLRSVSLANSQVGCIFTKILCRAVSHHLPFYLAITSGISIPNWNIWQVLSSMVSLLYHYSLF